MSNPHFRLVATVEEAAELVGFTPRLPAVTEGFDLRSIQVFVKDHEMRDVPIGERVVEVHYDDFVLAQSAPGPEAARRLALEVSYGRTATAVRILGRNGKMYELGPNPGPDDIDGRSPAVVTWHDEDMHLLVASDRLRTQELIAIAHSMYR